MDDLGVPPFEETQKIGGHGQSDWFTLGKVLKTDLDIPSPVPTNPFPNIKQHLNETMVQSGFYTFHWNHLGGV
jgi:hypothetical protein